jgi:hypothetical protein
VATLIRLTVFALALLLAACQPQVSPLVSDARLAPLSIPGGARRFVVQPGESELLVLVYREGRLARLGHNHVISSTQLDGAVYLAPDVRDSAVELRLPLAALEVDLPANRARAGDDFPGEIDADAVAGTRDNMLGPAQLDAERWPELLLVSRGVSGSEPSLQLQMELALKNQVTALTVPVRVRRDGDARLIAEGEFSVLQTELGLEPFSALLGALRVRDQVDIRFRIVAIAR